jgi:phosphotransferase system HPr (HPr) family protein
MNTHDSIHSRGGLGSFQAPGRQTETTVANASRLVTIENSLGLHMRPVMQFVDLANQFRARILVRKGEHAVDGKNPMEMMLLEAIRGTQLEIQAAGADAEDAVEALATLVKGGFGEE